MDGSMGILIAVLLVAVFCAAMLVVSLMQINSLRGSIEELGAKLKAVSARSTASQMPAGIEDRLAAIEGGIGNHSAALAGLERAIRQDRRSSSPQPSPASPAPVPKPRTDISLDAAKRPSTPPSGTDVIHAVLRSIATSEPRAVEAPAEVVQDPATPDDLVEAYKDLIARPRKNEIARWFEEHNAVPCEATDDNALQLVGRGDGARLMLVPLTEKLAIVLPSALMVVDFATSFSDILSARSAVRQIFALDADGSGTLRLVQTATAVLSDGVWRLKAQGALAGLASG